MVSRNFGQSTDAVSPEVCPKPSMMHRTTAWFSGRPAVPNSLLNKETMRSNKISKSFTDTDPPKLLEHELGSREAAGTTSLRLKPYLGDRRWRMVSPSLNSTSIRSSSSSSERRPGFWNVRESPVAMLWNKIRTSSAGPLSLVTGSPPCHRETSCGRTRWQFLDSI